MKKRFILLLTIIFLALNACTQSIDTTVENPIEVEILGDTSNWPEYTYDEVFPLQDPSGDETVSTGNENMDYNFRYPPSFEVGFYYGGGVPLGHTVRLSSSPEEVKSGIHLSIFDQGWLPLGDILNGALVFESEGLKDIADLKTSSRFAESESFTLNGIQGLRSESENGIEVILDDPSEDYQFVIFEVWESTGDEIRINTALLDQVLSTFSFKNKNVAACSSESLSSLGEKLEELYPDYEIYDIRNKCEFPNDTILVSFAYFTKEPKTGGQMITLLNKDFEIIGQTKPALISRTAGDLGAAKLELQTDSSIHFVFYSGDGPCSLENSFELDLDAFEYTKLSTVSDCG